MRGLQLSTHVFTTNENYPSPTPSLPPATLEIPLFSYFRLTSMRNDSTAGYVTAAKLIHGGNAVLPHRTLNIERAGVRRVFTRIESRKRRSHPEFANYIYATRMPTTRTFGRKDFAKNPRLILGVPFRSPPPPLSIRFDPFLHVSLRSRSSHFRVARIIKYSNKFRLRGGRGGRRGGGGSEAGQKERRTMRGERIKGGSFVKISCRRREQRGKQLILPAEAG